MINEMNIESLMNGEESGFKKAMSRRSCESIDLKPVILLNLNQIVDE
jgi:hypothetical protein